MPSLIAFDLDDTLYKERDYVASGRRAVAAALAPKAGVAAGILLEIMNSNADAFEALRIALAGTAAADTGIDEMVAIYRRHRPDIALSAGVAGTLAELRRRGNMLALITDGNHTRQHAKVRALGLDVFFGNHNIIVSDDIGSDKNTPVPFAAAEKLAPEMPHVYVGDNPAKDFRWPSVRGWHTVMIADNEKKNIHTQNIGGFAAVFKPQTVIDRFDRLLQFQF